MKTVDRQSIDSAAAALVERTGGRHDVAIVLGSGLGPFVGRLRSPVVVPCAELPHWPVARVIGHAGTIVAGELAGRRVLAMSGRVHAYEGHDLHAVTFAVRAVGRAGVRAIVLTNAAGGINPTMAPGSLMVIDDHINATGMNPLVGPNDTELGPRFPDMTEVYSSRLRRIADEAAIAAGVPVTHGVYIGVLGPSYETPAEIRAFRALGADAVGMSTVAEAIVARHMGLEVLGLSCIANAAAGMGGVLDEQDVIDVARGAGVAFARLLEEIIARS